MSQLNLFDQSPRPLIIAHRGSCLEAPENTLAAFLLSVDQGAHAIELDVTTCRSGDLVVIHDATVDRTTNGSGKVSDLTIDMIRTLDAGSWFSEKFTGEPVPTLDEVFEAIGDKCLINVELKNYATPFDNLAEKVAQTVIRYELQERVFFSSFNPLNFRKLKRMLPEAPVGLLTLKGKTGRFYLWLSRLIGPFDALNPHFSDVSAQLIERTHHARMPIFPYTVNEMLDIQRLVNAGLSGIITDNPALALEVVRTR